jgi:protein gp37
MNNRFGWIADFSKPQFFPKRLEKLKIKKPRNIFMDSMSDIADWDRAWLNATFEAISDNPQHNYLFLSKRPAIYDNWLQFGRENVWCGATGTDSESTSRAIYYLSGNVGCNTFLSLEPLLSEIHLPEKMAFADWVIIGAETGNRKGKVIPRSEWIKRIVAACDDELIPVFMKDSLIPIIGETNMRREFPLGLKKEESN